VLQKYDKWINVGVLGGIILLFGFGVIGLWRCILVILNKRDVSRCEKHPFCD
jgi:hypothetical protein